MYWKFGESSRKFPVEIKDVKFDTEWTNVFRVREDFQSIACWSKGGKTAILHWLLIRFFNKKYTHSFQLSNANNHFMQLSNANNQQRSKLLMDNLISFMDLLNHFNDVCMILLKTTEPSFAFHEY